MWCVVVCGGVWCNPVGRRGHANPIEDGVWLRVEKVEKVEKVERVERVERVEKA